MKQVKVALGYSGVPLLGKVYNQGQTVILTDDQYNDLPAFLKQQIVVVSSYSDPGVASPPITKPGPPDPTSYTDLLFEQELVARGVPIFLVWDGTNYQPSKLKNSLDRPKTFIGPQDPSNFAGVRLAVRDQWIDY